jgi:hypothetical protein
MPQKRKPAKVSGKIAKTIAKKSISRKAPKVNRSKTPHTKRSSPTKRGVSKRSYQNGQLLRVAYNGVGQEFVFTLANDKGVIGSTFHVKGTNLLETMSIPFMVMSQ